MTGRSHVYRAAVTWTGNTGAGTAGYKAYSRDHDIAIAGKPVIAGSSDAAFRGDAARHNPEDLLVASVSGCHMLWFLHLASAAGIVVTAYEDAPAGIMVEDAGGGGRFTEITLRPRVTLACGRDAAGARQLHAAAHAKCFIANSLNCPVTVEPTFAAAGPAARW